MGYPSNSDSVAQDQIRAFVERVERIESEVKDLNKDKSEVYAEAKGNGFDVPALKHVIKLRRQDATDRAEREAIIELYMTALGMAALPADWGGDDDSNETGTVDATRAPARPKFNPVTHAAGQGEGTAPGSLANQSTGASQERAQTATGVGTGGDNLGPASRSSAEAKTGVPAERETASDDQGQAPGDGQSQHNSGVRVAPVDTKPTAAGQARKLRPFCQHPDDLPNCAGVGKKHCYACLKAHADEEGIAA